MIRLMEENEDNRKINGSMSDGSDVQMDRTWDRGEVEMMECGLRWAVGARRKKEEGQRGSKRQDRSKARKCVSESEEMQVQSTDEQDVMSRLEEVRDKQRKRRPHRRGDEMRRTDDTSGKGKGKARQKRKAKREKAGKQKKERGKKRGESEKSLKREGSDKSVKQKEECGMDCLRWQGSMSDA